MAANLSRPQCVKFGIRYKLVHSSVDIHHLLCDVIMCNDCWCVYDTVYDNLYIIYTGAYAGI